MEHEIEISCPVPRRRLLDLRRLRRAALRFLCASGALCLFINLCTGGPAWSLVVLVSLWFVWTNLLARPLVEDGLAERISRLLLSVCILVLTVELCFGGEYTGIVLPILLACTLAFLAGTAYLGRRRRCRSSWPALWPFWPARPIWAAAGGSCRCCALRRCRCWTS